MLDTVIQILDTVEDAIIASGNRLRRILSRRPRERRQVPRTRLTETEQPQADIHDRRRSHPDSTVQ